MCAWSSGAAWGWGARGLVGDRPHTDTCAPWRQARTEWLSNVSFAMTRWEGTNAEAPLLERLGHLLLGFARVKHPDHAASRGTKTAPVSVSRIVSRVRVEQGWDKMYRNFCQTPGNTLSMQARSCWAAQVSRAGLIKVLWRAVLLPLQEAWHMLSTAGVF